MLTLFAFYAETGFYRKILISSNPSAFYVELGAAVSTKRTILKNPKGASKGAPRDAQGVQGIQGTPKGSQDLPRVTHGSPRDFQVAPGTFKTRHQGFRRTSKILQGLISTVLGLCRLLFQPTPRCYSYLNWLVSTKRTYGNVDGDGDGDAAC